MRVRYNGFGAEQPGHWENVSGTRVWVPGNISIQPASSLGPQISNTTITIGLLLGVGALVYFTNH